MGAKSFAERHAEKKKKKGSGHKGFADRMAGRKATMKVAKAAIDMDHRLIFGWASVISKDGAEVHDLEGDAINAATLEAAAHDYLQRSRVGKRGHRGLPAMELVESVVLTKEKQAAMGIDSPDEGWWVGFRVNDPTVWADAKAGKLPALSIHGSALRTPSRSDA